MISFCKALFQTDGAAQKKISDQASACTQREDKELKYQKKSVAGGLVCKLSGVQSSRQERQRRGCCGTGKLICTVFVNQWVANGEKQDEVSFANSQDKASSVVLNFLQFKRYCGQPDRRELQQSKRESNKADTRCLLLVMAVYTDSLLMLYIALLQSAFFLTFSMV